MIGFVKILQSKPVFAIHPEIGMQMLSAALSVMQRTQGFDPDIFHVTAAKSRMERISSTENPTIVNNVYVVPVHGTMFAADQECGPVGMLTRAREVRQAANDPNISGIVMDFMSPGGQVLGTEELAGAVAYARTRKPVLGFVNGMACSAAMRVAAECDTIMLNGPTAEVGSIGVALHYLDFSEKMAKEGIAEVKVMSTHSPDKNKFNLSQPEEADIKLIKSEMLDPLAIAFQEAIKSRRPDVDPAALTGNCYYAAQALELGLADSQGAWEEAMMWMQEAIEYKTNNPNSGKNMFGKKKDVTAEEVTLADIQAQHQKEMEDLKNKHQQELAEVTQNKDSEVSELTAQLSTLQNKVTALETKVNDLSKAPVNEVADPDGDEGVPAQDAADDRSANVQQPAWAGAWDNKLKELDNE